MKNMKISSSRGFLRSKGLIAAISVCLIAVGAAAYVGLSDVSEPSGQTLTGDASGGTPSVPTPPPSSKTESKADTSSVNAPSKPSSQAEKPVSDAPSVNNSQSGEGALTAVTPSASFFVMPLTGEVLKGFSDTELQYSMTYSDWRLHTGIDIAGKIGDTVNAAGDGVVISVTEDTPYGKAVEINHGNGIIARYCGFDTVTVEKGDSVKANGKIGTLGEIPCECVEAVHLHLSVTKENKPVDPLNIMGLDQ